METYALIVFLLFGTPVERNNFVNAVNSSQEFRERYADKNPLISYDVAATTSTLAAYGLRIGVLRFSSDVKRTELVAKLKNLKKTYSFIVESIAVHRCKNKRTGKGDLGPCESWQYISF